MQPTTSLKQKLRQFLIILGPIFITQITLSAMNVVDTMMSGQFSSVDLAGVAIGTSLWIPVQTGLGGILVALTPIVAQHIGGQRHDRIRSTVIQGVYLALALTAITTGAVVGLFPAVLQAMALEDAVRQVAHRYLIALATGIAPLFVYTILRSFIDALGQTRVTMAITLLSFPLNVVFNAVLIFGLAGFPALGGVGAGYATAITYWLIALMAVAVVIKNNAFRRYEVFAVRERIRLAAWWEQLRIGVPMGLSIFLEVSVFSTVALLMSSFGTITVAAHQAATNFASLLYMVPLSVSMALTITVGFEAGAQRIDHARQYTRLGLGISVLAAGMAALLLLKFRLTVAQWYTNDEEVLVLTGAFLSYVIFFQLSDAIAAPIQGALRGYKDVNVVLALSIMSYWFVGLPVGFSLANFTKLGPSGYWIGLISGLASGAAGLMWRLRRGPHRDAAAQAASYRLTDGRIS